MTHKKDPSPTGRQDIFRGGGIGQIIGIKPHSFILYFKANFASWAIGWHNNLFADLGTIAVDDGITHRFSKGDKHVAKQIPVDLILLDDFAYIGLYLGDVFGVRV